MIVRARAPLRLGLAGGGTDVSPYSDNFGGNVLNATIDLFAYCTIELKSDGQDVHFQALDVGESFISELSDYFPLSGKVLLHKAVYNRIIRDFNKGQPLPIRITTWADAPPGSGLGTSSTMVVTILTAFQKLLQLSISEYDLAHLAYEIERIDCGLAGGRQDQYAATFGGFNFMEFFANDRVVVNPLRIRRHIENELHSSILLYFTGRSRESAKIIDDQVRSTQFDQEGIAGPLYAMHQVKQFALEMKSSLLRGDINGVHDLFRNSWEAKKQMALSISNPEIEKISNLAFGSGAKAVKISGAGGGGFMMIFTDSTNKLPLINAFTGMLGHFHRFQFTHQGAEAWIVK